MWETFHDRPQDLAAVLAISAICVAVVLVAGIKAWHRNETKKHETEVKLEMISRGMSAEEISRVLAAKLDDSTLSQTEYRKKE